MILTVHEGDVVGEFRDAAPARGPLTAYYLPALAHALLAQRPRPWVRVADASGPWSAGAADRCLLVRPDDSVPGRFLAVHWAHRNGDDLSLGWHLVHAPDQGEDAQQRGSPTAALAWAQRVHQEAVLPVLRQLAGPA